MDELERRRLRKRNVSLATAGLLVIITTGYGLRLAGFSRLDYRDWTFVLFLTLAVQLATWLVPHFGWDKHLTWDPHYMIVPMLSAVFLLNAYIYFATDSRVRVLMVWFVALMFMAGFARFREVAGLGTAMALGYVIAVSRSPHRPPDLKLSDEIVLACVFWGANLFAGLVFARLHRQRLEMQALRRRLADHALTDALTGLPNRRRFDEALRTEVARTIRYGGRCSVALLDVDHFKNYNDRMGHPAGDAVLKDLGDVLRREVRKGDLAARIGGEEFALLMLNTGREEAARVVDRMRRVIEQAPFVSRDVQPTGRLTVSAGVAEFPGDGADEAAFVASADAALYRAKSAGRNQVVAAGAPLLQGEVQGT
jgi:diguanylate cyclase (GGDEF)-like protein